MKKINNIILFFCLIFSIAFFVSCDCEVNKNENKDVTPPGPISNLTAKCTASGTVKLIWTNPTDADFAKTVVTYDTEGKVEVLKPNNEATITDLTNDTEYTFTVKAYDSVENASGEVSVKCKPFSGGTIYTTGTNGGLEGYSLQMQGEIVKETWMSDNGNLEINGKEIAMTSEVVVVPTRTVAKINIISDTTTSEIFTDSRKVKLSPFVMSQYEVTRDLFKAVMEDYYKSIEENQADTNGTESENPICVSWFDAIIFCNKLSMLYGLEAVYSYDFSTDGTGKMTDPADWFNDTTNLSPSLPENGRSTNYSNWKDKVVINLKANGYRLPTEAEWEFCARGGDPNAEDWGYAYSGSDTVDDVAWFTDNAYESGTNIVGYMNKANRLGLYDMSGNVFEWCDDYDNDTATVDDPKYIDSEGYVKDPLVVIVSDCRIQRGGCWFTKENTCEVGIRDSFYPFTRWDHFGFRLVRSTEVAE